FDLAELILHEMTHETLFKPDDTGFNEAMATFVGRAAAAAWFDHADGSGSATAAAARARFADKAVIDGYAEMLFDEASRYFDEAAARGETLASILAGKSAMYAAAAARFETDFEPRLSDPDRWAFIKTMPLDNARVLAGVRYQGGLSDFSVVLDKVGGRFPDALAVYGEAARRSDSREYLRTWAATH
ncbi:MAG: aminopeptidase, partial [Phycisphaerae bacterium]